MEREQMTVREFVDLVTAGGNFVDDWDNPWCEIHGERISECGRDYEH